MDEKLLSIQEAAKKLKVSTKTLRRWENKGVLTPIRTEGGHRRYTQAQINDFIAKAKIKAPVVAPQPPVAPDFIAQSPVTAPLADTSPFKATPPQAPVNVSAQTPPQHPTPSTPIASNPKESVPTPVMRQQVDQKLPEKSDVTIGYHFPFHNRSKFFIGGSVAFAIIVFLFFVSAPSLQKAIRGSIAGYLNLQPNTPIDKTLFANNSKPIKGDITFEGNVFIKGKLKVDSTILAANYPPKTENYDTSSNNSSSEEGTELVVPIGSGLNLNGGILTNTDKGSDQKIFKTIKAGSTTTDATSNTDTFEFASGNGISLSLDNHNKKLTITNTGNSSSNSVTELISSANGSGSTSSFSGLEFVGSNNELGLLQGCSNGELLKWNSSTKEWECSTDLNGAGGSVTSVDGLVGALTISNTSGAGATITIDDASTTQKGIAQFNATNFSASSGTINTIQNISTTSSPTFNNVTLSSLSTTGIVHNNASGVLSTSALNLAGGVTEITGTLPIGNGGTGTGSTPTNGQVLIGNGTGYSLATLTQGTGITVTNGVGTISIASTLGTSIDLTSEVTGLLPVGNGGTGTNSFTAGGILYGNTTSPVASSAQGVAGQVLLSGGSGAPTWTTGTLALGGNLITSGGSAVTFTSTGSTNVTLPTTGTLATLAGNEALTNKTINGLTPTSQADGFTISGGTISRTLTVTGNSLSLNQSLLTSSSPTFGGLTLTGFANCALETNGSGVTICGVGAGSDWTIANGSIYPVNNTLDFLIGSTATSTAKFAVLNVNGARGTQTASISGNIVLDNAASIQTTNNQNLTLGGNTTGNIAIATLSTGIVKANASGILSSAAVNLSTADITGTLGVGNGGTGIGSVGSAGSIAYSNGSAYAFSAVGTPGDCLLSAGSGSPTWGSCAGGGASSFGTTGGLLYPLDTTVDFAIGGTATTSAKFGVFGVGTDTPVASLSASTGYGLTLGYDGTIQTTKDQTLTIGGNTTGNITLSPLNGNGKVRSTGTIDIATGKTYQINGSDILSLTALGGSVVSSSLTSVGTITSGTWNGSTISSQYGGTGQNFAASTGVPTLSSGTWSVSSQLSAQRGGTGIDGSGATNGQVLIGNGSGYTLSTLTQGSGITITNGAGSITIDSSLGVSVDLGSEVTGTLGVGNGGTGTGSIGSAGTVAYSNGTTLAYTGVGAPGDCLISTGATTPTWGGCSGGGSSGWLTSAGLFYPADSTVDLAVGGTSTASARFGIFGVNTDTPVASISASTGYGISLAYDGSIQTTKNQSLTIGGNTTGNIILSPNGGNDQVISSGSINVASGKTYKINGVDVLSSSSLGTGITGSSLTSVGTITSGVWNASLIGTAYGGLGADVTAAGAGEILYSTGTNTYGHLAAGINGQCLTSSGAGAPVWGPCGSMTSSPFGESLGSIIPFNSTEDFLIGGQATTSAKFAVLGINEARGTQIASLSGSLVLDSLGSIQTTNKQTLTIGGSTTGAVAISGIGTGVVHSTNGVLSTAVVTNAELQNSSITVTGGTGLGVSGSPVSLGGTLTLSNTGVTSNVAGSGISVNQATGAVTITNTGVLSVVGGTGGTAQTGALTINNAQTSGGAITIDDATAIAKGIASFNSTNFSVSSGAVNTIQNITTTSSPTFNGLTLSGLTLTGFANCTLKTDGSGITTCGTDSIGTNYWNQTNGVITPSNSTVDFLLGSQSTDSAKFAILNINGARGTQTATLSGNLTLDAASSIQTTNNQTLTLGGNSTGNIILSPNAGTGTVLATGDLNLSNGKAYYINGTSALSSNTLGTAVTASSLTSVGALASGSIANGFGTILTSNTIQGSDITASGTTGFISSGAGADLTFDASGTHTISATSGTLELGALTLTGAISGNGQNITGLGTINGLAITANTGTITSGTWNGAVIGAAYGGTGIDGSSAGNGTVLIGNGSGYTLANLSAGSGINISNGPGSISISSTIVPNSKFTQNDSLGVLYPNNNTLDFLIGGTSTSAAKFAITGVNDTRGQQTATLSGSLTLDSSGSLQTTNNQTLTIGGNTTGNVILSPNNGTGTVTSTGDFNLASGKAFTINGTSVLNGTTLGTGITGSSLTSVGTITSGTWNGTSIAPQYGGTGQNFSGSTGVITVNSGTFVASAQLSTALGGLGANITAAGAGELLYSTGTTTYGHLAAGVGGQCLTSGGAGAPVWAPCGTSSVTPFQELTGAIVPNNSTVDFLIGGQATTSAKFAVLGINGNRGTQIASISGNIVLDSAGSIQTTNNQDLTIGGNTTGGIILSPNNGNGSVNSTGDFNLSNGKSYFINGVNVLSGSTLGSGITASSLTSVGTISTGIWNATAIGAQYGGTGIDTSGATGVPTLSSGTWSVSAQLSTLRGGTGVDGSTAGNGTILIGNGSGYSLANITAGTGISISNGSGSITIAQNPSANPFASNLGAIYENNATQDFLIGSQSTSSAKFAILNVNGTRGTQTASVAGNLVLDAAGSLQTTLNQTLTIGGNATGNIILSPNNGSGITTSTGDFNLSSGKAFTINGASVLSGSTLGSGVTASSLTSVGTITSGTWNGTAIGTLYGGTGIDTSGATGVPTISGGTWSVGAQLSALRGGTGVDGSAAGNGTVLIGNGSGYSLSTLTAGTGVSITNGVGSITISQSPSSNPFTSNLGTIFENNTTQDFLLGSQSTSSAKFAVLNINGTRGSQTASLSGNLVLDAVSSIQTTNNQTLTIGGNTTGNIILSPNNGSSTVNSTGDFALANGKAYYINGANVLNGSTLGTGILSSSLTSVGALASGSIANGFGTILTGNTIQGTDITASGTTGFISSGAGADLLFNASGTHTISASSGTLELGALTLNGAITGNSQNITGLGTINGLAITANTGVITTGTWNGTAVGAQYGGTGIDTSGATGVPTLSSGTWSVSAQLSALRGGTGIDGSSAGNGTVLIGNGSGYSLANLTAGTGISISNGSGSITIAQNPSDNPFTSNLGAIFENNTSQDFLIGSQASSSAKFAILNVNGTRGSQTASLSGSLVLDSIGSLQTTLNQSLTLGGGTTGNLILGKSGQILTLPGFDCSGSGNGGKLTTTAGGVLTCASDGTGSTSYSPFQESTSLGINYQVNTTEDFLLGDTATSSAKFAFIGNSLARGLQTASISGNIVLDSTGSIQTTKNQSLTIGGNTTGNIYLDSANGVIRAQDEFIAAGEARVLGYAIYWGTGDCNANFCISSGSVRNPNSDIALSGNGVNFNNTNDTTVGTFRSDTIQLGIGTSSPISALHVSRSLSSTALGKAVAIFNQVENQDIFAASASGVTKFTINNGGNLGIAGSNASSSNYITAPNFVLNTSGQITTGTWQGTIVGTQYGGTGLNASGVTQGNIPYFSGTGVLAALAPSTAGWILSTNGVGANPSWIDPATLTSNNYWDIANGVITPKMTSTLDLLLGGTSTASAKFAFINVNNGTPTASVSAGTNGSVYLTATGLLATTARQTLTLGDTTTTGNIVINSGNGSGSSNGSSINLTAGSAGSSGTAGGGVNITAGAGTNNNAGGVVTLTGGAGNNAGAGGNVALIGGAPGTNAGATAGKVTLTGGTGTNTPGGAVELTGGAGNLAGAGGAVTLTGGIGGNNGSVVAGAINLIGGAGAGSAGVGGGINLTTGAGSAGSAGGASGSIAIASGNGGNGSVIWGGNSGDIGFTIGTPGTTTSGAGANAGNFTFTGSAGTAGTSSNAGGSGSSFTFTAGNGGQTATGTGGSAGAISLTAGNGGLPSGAGTGAAGGAVALTAGNGTLALAGGAVNLTAGQGGATGNGGAMTFTTGAGGATSGNSGALALGTGTVTSGSFGTISLKQGTNTRFYIDANGLIGIGSTTPVSPLFITGGYANNAAFILNQNNNGDIFAASASGTTKFVIKNDGTASSSAGFTVDGIGNIQSTNNQTLTIGGNTTGGINIGGNGDVNISSYTTINNGFEITGSNTSRLKVWGSSGTLLLQGASSGIYDCNTFKVICIGAGSGFGTNVLKSTDADFGIDTGTGIFLTSNSASVSGNLILDAAGSLQTTKSQTLTLGGGTTGNLILGRTGQILTLPGFDCSGSGNGGKLTTTTGGVLTCASDGTGSTSYSPFQESTVLGINYQVNTTEDFLIGGVATTSAKFAFININNGTPTASISANNGNNALFISGDGSISTTNRGTIKIGGTSAGNIVFAPGGSDHAVFDNNGNLNLNGTSTSQNAGNTIYGSTAANGNLYLGSTTNGTKGAVYFQSTSNYIDGTNNLLIAGDATFTGNNIGIGTTANGSSNLRFNGSSNIDVFSNLGSTILTIENKGVGGPASTYIEGGLAVGTSTFTGGAGTFVGGISGGNAALIVNQNGASTNDILAASASGTTKFVIKNDGTASSSAGFTIDGIGQIQSTLGQTLTIGGGTSGNVIIGQSGKGITLPGFTGQNGILYATQTTGVLAQATTGSTGLCLLSGASAPTWSTCPAGSGFTQWELANGAIYSGNTTLDLLLGGTATTSAKFAILGINNARGQQTASVSGNFVLDAAGSLQTTNNQTLTLGGSTTGNIIIDSNSNLITANDAITLTNGTLNSSVASGGTAFTLDADNAFSTGNLFSLTENNGGTQHLTIDDAGNFNLNGTSATKDSGNTIYGSTAANGTLFLISTTNSTKGAVYFQSTSNYVDGSNNLQLAGDATFSGNNIGIGTTANSGSNLRFSGSSNIDVFSNVGTTLLTIENKGVGGPASTYIEGKLGVGTSTLTGVGNFVGGNTGGNAALIVNQTGASGNDIFAASTSGITKFVIKNDGTASSSAGFTIDGIGNIQSTNYQTLTLGGGSTGNLILGKSSQSITLPGFDCSGSGNGGKLTTTAGGVLTCASDTSGGTGGYSPFQESTSLGLNYQVNNTEDFLIGGVATTSAKFAILGVAGARGTQTASLSGNIVLDAAGSLQTTKNQTLTIGGNTTGDIQLLPSNGSGTVYIGSGNGGQTIRTGGNLSIVPSDNVGGFNYVDIGEQVGNSLNGATFWFKDVAVGEGLHLKTPSALTTGSWETDGGFVTAFNGDVGTILSVESQGSITQTAAYIGANIDLATQVTVPNSSSGNQTGISLTLEDGGTSATTKGLILADTGTTGIDYGIDFSGVGKFNIAGINLNSGGNGTAISATANAGGQAAFILNKTGSSGNIFTASASGVTKFNIGLDGTASSSAGFTIDGIGNIQSTNYQTFTLGGNTTGNIMLSPLNNQGGVAINKTLGPLASLDIKDLSSVASQGSEKITNSNDSTFASNTGNWTTSGTPDWAINVASSGQARKNAPGTGALTLSNSALDSAPVAGQTYRVIFDYTTTASSSGNLIPSFGGTNGVTVGTEASEFSTSQVQIITATNTNQLQFTPSINWYGTIDNVYVEQITTSSVALRVEASNGSTNPLEIRTGGDTLKSVFIGNGSGKSNTTGSLNLGVGYQALQSNTTGSFNTALGYKALINNTSAQGNTAVGYGTLFSNTIGDRNTALGSQALLNNTSGSYNTALGFNSLGSNTIGTDNISIGYNALSANTSGNFNISIGNSSLLSNSRGNYNAAIGYQALYNNTLSNNNVAYGYRAGFTNTVGGSNSFFGYLADVGLGNLINATAIGANSYVSANDSLVLGSIYGVNSATGSAKIGIGTTAPKFTLDINGGYGSNALLSLNQTNNSDILTASASGVTKFVIKNDGTASSSAGFTINGVGNIQSTRNQTLTIGGGSTGNLILGKTSQTITLPGFDCSGSGNGGKLTTTAGGVLTCSADSSSAGGSSPFQESTSLGLNYQVNTTEDFLIGGVATTSAKFAILGVAGTSPTASISAQNALGQALVLGSDGTIQSTRNNSLTLGGNTTGNIILRPTNGAGRLTIIHGTTGTGGVTLQDSETNLADKHSRLRVAHYDNSEEPVTLIFGESNATQNNIYIGGISASENAATEIDFLTALNNTTLSGTRRMRIMSNGDVSIGNTVTPLAKLHVEGGDQGGNAAVIFNQIGPSTNDIFAASSSGVTKFVIKNDGTASSSAGFTINGIGNIQSTNNQTLTIGGGSTGNLILGQANHSITLPSFTNNNNSVLYSGANGVLGVAETTNSSYCLLSNGGTAAPSWGVCPTGSGITQWTISNGAIISGNQTLDLVYGGVTSSSAVFKVTGQGNPFAGTLVGASVSANTSFAGLVVDNKGVGDIFTASSSGLTRFVVTQNGNVGIGTNTPGQQLNLFSSANTSNGLRIENSSSGNSAYAQMEFIANNSRFHIGVAGSGTPGSNPNNFFIYDYNANSTRLSLTPLGNLGIGTQAPAGEFQVTRPISWGATGKALAIFDQIENQDIFTASASGTTRFTISNSGYIGINRSPISGVALALGGTDDTKIISLGVNADNSIGFTSALSTGGTGTIGVGPAFNSSGNHLWFVGDSVISALDTWQTSSMAYDKAQTTLQVGVGTTQSPVSGNLGAMFQVYSSLGTSPAASVSAVSSFAALSVNNSGVGDLFTASSSGLTRFVVGQNGNVGIGTSTPTEKLSVAGNIFIDQAPNSSQSDQQNWTLTTHTTPGTIVSGGTSSVASISASTVFNGSLYIGTSKTDGAEVYRYNGSSGNWTKVSQSTAGTIANGGTANIDTVSSMIVYNGKLYIGTTDTGGAEVYEYQGGTTWNKISQAAAGTIRSGGTSGIYGAASMVVYGGRLFVGTELGGRAELYRWDGVTNWTIINTTAGTFVTTNSVSIHKVSSMAVMNGTLYLGLAKPAAADLVRYNGNTGASVFTKLNNNTGGTFSVNGANITAMNDIPAMAVYNGRLYIAINKANAADVIAYDSNTQNTTTNTFHRIINAAGQIDANYGSSINGVTSIAVYNGRLYIGTNEPSAAEIYRYEGVRDWTRVSQGSSGVVASGGTTGIDAVVQLQPYNGSLYAGTYEAAKAEVYNYALTQDQSYSLVFHAGTTGGGGEQNNLMNVGRMFFMASPSANMTSVGQQGAFFFTHGIQTQAGAYDVAEDYPTRDDTLQPGDLIEIDPNERGYVRKSSGSYADGLVGVYSENPGFRLSQVDQSIDNSPVIPVALAGRVPAKVSTENGPIQAGDYLTSSSVPGVAMKATKGGNVIGKAMEPYSEEGVGKILVYVNASQTIGDTNAGIFAQGGMGDVGSDVNSNFSTFLNVNGDFAGKIRENVSGGTTYTTASTGYAEWYKKSDQSDSLENGDIVCMTTSGVSKCDNNGTILGVVTDIPGFEGNAAHANDDGYVLVAISGQVATKIDTESNIKKSDAIGISETPGVGTKITSGFTLGTALEDASSSSNGAILVSVNPTYKADIAMGSSLNTLAVNNSSQTSTVPSSELKSLKSEINYIEQILSSHSENIIANQESMATLSARLDKLEKTHNLTLTPFASSSSEFATVAQDLVVFGNSSFNNASVQESLSIGNSMTISNGSINTIGTGLALQSLRQGDLDLMAGAVIITTDGTMHVKENAEFGKDVTVKGVLSAQSVNLQKGGYIELSATEASSSATAGSSTIRLGQTQRKIYNPNIKSDSLIYVTPTSRTGAMTPYISEQSENGKYFIVEIENTIQNELKFNYLIINRN